MIGPAQACPCGSGASYRACCGALHAGTELASSAEALMRSRYSAYALGLADYLLQTWHPSTRPARLQLDPAVSWTRLKVHAASSERVAFTAVYKVNGRADRLDEDSRFAEQNGRLYYVGGVTK